MNNFKTGYGQENQIGQSEFDLFKAESLSKIKTVAVPASKLELVKDGLKIEHNGSSQVFGFKDRASMYGIIKGGKGALKSVEKKLKRGGEINNFLLNQFLKASKDSVSLSFNDKTITSASLTKSRVSAHQYFRFVEEIINKYNLEIDQVDNNGGGINMSFRTNNEIDLGPNEIFKTGFNLSWNQNIKYNPYVLRLICTNGMTIPSFTENVVMNEATQTAWNLFLKDIDLASKVGFLPNDFAKAHNRANETCASLDEFKFAYKQLKWAIGDDNVMNCPVDLINGGQTTFGAIVNNINTELALVDGKYEFETLDNFNLKSQKAPMTVMSLVNTMTDIGSHDYGFQNYHSNNLRVNAGRLFGKERFDNENSIPQIEFYNI